MVVKIAIVDDESTAASLLEGCLHQYAEETGTAMQWEQFPDAEAFLKSDTHAFDIVFMDIDMPGRNGIEASRALRERNQSIVLLFVTNLAQYAIAGYEVDALDYILKPINYFSFSIYKYMLVLIFNTIICFCVFYLNYHLIRKFSRNFYFFNVWQFLLNTIFSLFYAA